MEFSTVRELMIPLDEYATVAEDATLYEAVAALEASRQKLDPERDRHRAVIVIDSAGRIAGKVNLWDVLSGMEPKYKELTYPRETLPSGVNSRFVRSMLTTYDLWKDPLKELCRNASEIKVKDIMHVPGPGELIDETASLEEAINQLVVGHYQSLLVTTDGAVVGVLRLSDVFREISDRIKECRC